MRKTFDFGKVDFNERGRKTHRVTIDIDAQEKNGHTIFSACGNVWNTRGTDVVMAGQCLDEIAQFRGEMKNVELFDFIHSIWKEYHLNDMRPGTPEQEQAVKEWKAQGNHYDYTEVCEMLKARGLYEVEHEGKPYKYGHGWIVQEIPADVLMQMREKLGEWAE